MFGVGDAELHMYQNFLSDNGYIDKIYEALENDDPSEVVIATMDVLKNTVKFDFERESKSEHISNKFREQGNRFYKAKRFRSALEFYNQALLYAQENSQAMKLAYSNRSALLFTIKAYSSCVNDIETFFSMGCTDYKISQRLKQRKQECLQHVWLEKMALSGTFVQNFFNFDVKRNPQIPCASADVEAVTESGLPKIVAARDVPVGRVVAVESPFVSHLNQRNYNISCHYCHRLSFNLIPCDACCVALFCDEKCMSKCKIEYHNIECKLTLKNRIANSMKLRAAIKIRQMCKSWKELIAASHNIGEDRMRSSSISDVYDSRSKFSLLSFNNPSHFVHGKRYNQSFVCGMDLHVLENIGSFFPKEAYEKAAAMRAMARIMMQLETSYRMIEILNAAKDPSAEVFTSNTEHNFGWFSFTGKLKHSCNSNLMVLGLKNELALVAIRPIKKGDELTISFMGHYCEHIPSNRPFRLFYFTRETCNCQVCVEQWSSRNLRKLKLNQQQKKAYLQWASIVQRIILIDRDQKVFQATCEGLTALKGAECTTEYHDMFKMFRNLTTVCQIVASDNHLLQNEDEEFETVIRN